MQSHRSQALKNGLLTLFFLALYYAGKWMVLTTWPTQSAISPEEAGSLYAGICGALVSLVGIGWAWSKSKGGTYRGGVWMRWIFISLLVLFAGLILVTWNKT